MRIREHSDVFLKEPRFMTSSRSLYVSLYEAVLSGLLTLRLYLHIVTLWARFPGRGHDARSTLLIGVTRLGKSCIGEKVQARKALIHCKIDPYSKILKRFASTEKRLSEINRLVLTLLQKSPRGLLIEGVAMNALFVDHRARTVNPEYFLIYKELCDSRTVDIFFATADTENDVFLKAIVRGRKAGQCWTVRTYGDEDLPKLIRVIKSADDTHRKIAVEHQLNAIHVDIETREKHLTSIEHAAELIARTSREIQPPLPMPVAN